MRSQTAAPRGRQFLFLVGAVELLYSVSNSSNQAPRDVKVQESTIVATQYQVLRLLLSRPHFEEILTPEQQQRVVDQARNTVFETCEAFHRACWTFLAVYRYAVQHGHHELPRPPTLPDAHALVSPHASCTEPCSKCIWLTPRCSSRGSLARSATRKSLTHPFRSAVRCVEQARAQGPRR